MDTYILHVYRREPEVRAVSGLAERVADGAKQAFRTVDELWAFLLADETAAKAALPKNNSQEPI